MRTKATAETLRQALDNVNTAQGYQLQFNRFERIGNYMHFTIKTKSGIPRARVSHSGRNLAAASWHAHGYLFDEIFKLEPDAVIYSGGQKITKDEGNWVDRNIGSYYSPCMFSETSIL